MTVRKTDDGTIALEGRCPVEDAETLVRMLTGTPFATIDWRDCDHAHTALIQILLAARPRILGPAKTHFLRTWIEPVLAGEHC